MRRVVREGKIMWIQQSFWNPQKTQLNVGRKIRVSIPPANR